MPIRNPFVRRPGIVVVTEENVGLEQDAPNVPGFERVDTVGSKASSVLSIRSTKGRDTGEYKMSVVNDSGVYLPPSPTEDKGQWPRKYLSRNSTDTRSSFGDIEHFSISRESFDSYRRSFDVSARSPITNSELPGRQSLDSARFPRLPRTAMDRSFERQPATAEEGFEDVGLEDKQPQPRKRGFFSKFSETQEKEKDTSVQPAVSRFLIHSRKRAPSGQGAELGSMDQPKGTANPEGQEMH
ncbi:hypothetical protein B0J13DRAFT_26146 [Dactylonectria estremocensis]|uniref:Uncharacterized protein n=1 Tax=Dactylonectria estremocensis TaxID=1079267 RepID=A0A9P9FK69_9HYPO|nr:hypothetical protein B0J13DRAFT_26146 [Dactylonectria estremocensis]